MTTFNRLAKILAIHLYIVLQHEIGLKSFHISGFGTLGISEMAVTFISLLILPDLKKDLTAAHTKLPTMFQALFFQRALNPSGPGALLSFIEKIAS